MVHEIRRSPEESQDPRRGGESDDCYAKQAHDCGNQIQCPGVDQCYWFECLICTSLDLDFEMKTGDVKLTDAFSAQEDQYSCRTAGGCHTEHDSKAEQVILRKFRLVIERYYCGGCHANDA